MKRSGPLFTLLAGLVLGFFMLSLNATTGSKSASSSYTEESPSPKASPAPTKTTASPSPTPSRTPVPDADYTGRTTDDSASVAVSLRDGKAVAYFCDGRDKESWLKGDVEDDGTMRLTGKNGAKLNGTLEGKQISGTVDIDGGHYDFTADRAKKPDGLYRATGRAGGTDVDGGWIVRQGGTQQVGILNRDGEPSPAPRIDPETGAVTVDGEQLTARPVTP
ncbi:hypothetical protein [Streptomyces sp. GESEQ-4]|uniref:hypothetical protein n=1 Tax=Streptomyces sp. GESEQ-4 TaxID=2812655 RepID=UPI001B3212EF|nr:hypothetical protein [Streptomyces sp. GESEQ-4]